MSHITAILPVLRVQTEPAIAFWAVLLSDGARLSVRDALCPGCGVIDTRSYVALVHERVYELTCRDEAHTWQAVALAPHVGIPWA